MTLLRATWGLFYASRPRAPARARARKTARITLHLAGTPWEAGAYRHRILARVRASGGWITDHEGLSREGVSRLIAGNRFMERVRHIVSAFAGT